jgi:hypothetical protein
VHAELDVGGHAVARQLVRVLRVEGATCGIRPYRPRRLDGHQRVLIVVAEDAGSRLALERAGVVDERGRPRAPDDAVTSRACCRIAALRGAFAVGGGVASPGRPPALEIRTHGEAHARVLARCAAAVGLDLRVRERERWAEVATRRREAVEGMLVVLGAAESALALAEDAVLRSARADANRRANFDTANLGRQIASTRRQLEAIATLREEGRLASLSEPLRAVAEARGRHPEAPLAELAELLGAPRPTVAARLRRLVALAGDEDRGMSRRGSA